MPNLSVPKKIRKQVSERAGYCCEYCLSQVKYSPDPFSIEHIFPISKGGENNLDNLAYSCQGCNSRKYNHIQAVDPVTGNMVDLFNPRKHNWKDHFCWNEDSTQLLGLSPTGRATVEKLQLNRTPLLNLRALLLIVGEHPPEPTN